MKISDYAKKCLRLFISLYYIFSRTLAALAALAAESLLNFTANKNAMKSG